LREVRQPGYRIFLGSLMSKLGTGAPELRMRIAVDGHL